MVIPGLALSNVSEGSVDLCVDELLHGHGSIADQACSAGHASSSSLTTKRHSINVTTLDRWWASLVHKIPKAADVGVSMLKIDTEGAELMVLLGGASFITSQSPEIFLELSSHTEDFGYDSWRITELLNSWGYVGKTQGDGNAHFIRFRDSFSRTLSCSCTGRRLMHSSCQLRTKFDDLPQGAFQQQQCRPQV